MGASDCDEGGPLGWRPVDSEGEHDGGPGRPSIAGYVRDVDAQDFLLRHSTADFLVSFRSRPPRRVAAENLEDAGTLQFGLILVMMIAACRYFFFYVEMHVSRWNSIRGRCVIFVNRISFD